ncbi:uncharacterized protein LOC124174034 [Ischnura elegans]|uniref:uncharacterized protein LOC124174034 n=1 Tax=Ischnura elegans TaxID=197161 RepID=UPI001ED867D0|nr:uncharacterized protein LOC124174034 [Ischnura elegans]
MKVRDTTALLTALFAASLLYPASGVEESPEGDLVWIEGDSHVSMPADSSLELTCHARISDPSNILWVKVNDDGSVIISHDEKLLIENDRISINYNSSEGISLLKIEDVNGKDSGRYECQMPTMNTTFSAAVEVAVDEDANESTTTVDSNLPTNSSTEDVDEHPLSRGHSVTFSVFLIPSFVCTCIIFNAIPALELF